MTDLLIAIGESWPKFLCAFTGFFLSLGFIPSVLVTVITMIFPKGHHRRREIRAEFDVVRRAEPYHKRVVWVGEHLELAVREGIPARYRQSKIRQREAWRRWRSGGRWSLRLVVRLSAGLLGVAASLDVIQQGAITADSGAALVGAVAACIASIGLGSRHYEKSEQIDADEYDHAGKQP